MAEIVSRSFDAIGTRWNIDVMVSSTDVIVGLFEEIDKRIEIFDQHYSRFRPDSLVAEMAKSAGVYELPDDARQMMDLYAKLYRATNGLFTPLIGSLLVEAGYDASYSLKPHELHAPVSWDEVLVYDFPRLELKQPVLIDFGGIGKGYLIDIVGEIIKKYGIDSCTIDAGGDILHHDSKGSMLRVGLEHPHDQTQVIGVAPISNQSICCSAGNRRAWEGFHHIINPQTLTSPRHVESVWVVAPSALIADALATCLFLVTPEQLLIEFSFEYLLMYPDHSVRYSSGFNAELFTT